MGCCEVREARPVGRARFAVGLVLLAVVHVFFYAVVAARSLFEPRYRPIRRFYPSYLREVLRDVASRREIVLAGRGALDPRPAGHAG